MFDEDYTLKDKISYQNELDILWNKCDDNIYNLDRDDLDKMLSIYQIQLMYCNTDKIIPIRNRIFVIKEVLMEKNPNGA